MSWISVHAFCHGDLDALLLDGVRPLVTRLRAEGLVDGFFFLRYWDGGPHLRVRLSAPGGEQAVRDRAVGWLRGYLRANPSADLINAVTYRSAAARYAAAEGVAAYLPKPMPNNSVHEIPYRPETDRYGEGQSLATVERHFVESSRIALGLVAAGLNPSQRYTAALSAVALAWRTGPLPRPPLKNAYEPRYVRMRAQLHKLAGQLNGVVAGTSQLPSHGALTAWWQTVQSLPNRQIADLCGHLFCNRLGLGPEEERYVRYLAARTLAESGA
jgi:hypothetical protein